VSSWDQRVARARAEGNMVTADLLVRLGPEGVTRRRSPRIRYVAGRAGAHVIVSGPHRTRRAAFREARKFRELSGGKFVVMSKPPLPGRKLPRWFVARPRLNQQP
jgi:hypothetical protein